LDWNFIGNDDYKIYDEKAENDEEIDTKMNDKEN